MDGLSALGIAASVAQFIEFGCGLVLKTREIYKSTQGTSVQYAELEMATKRLLALNAQLDASRQIKKDWIERESQALEDIQISCVTISVELLARLEQLKIHEGHKHRRWKSFRQALKSVCSKGEIDAMAKKLQAHQRELDGHILMSLSVKFNNLRILQDENFSALDTNLQQSVRTLLENLIDIHKKMERVLEVQQSTLDRTQQKLLSETRKAEAEEAKQAAEKARKLDDYANESLLCSLRFPTMRNRHEEISEAHQRTFSWIFQPPQQSTRPWSDFPNWLRMDSNIYWVNGKAGSGKSTLMRYIYDNPETSKYLKSWAGCAELDVAGFFFWNSGSIEQRSQSGVFRSLLFEILRKRRDLTRFVFEAPWAEFRSLTQADDKNDRVKTFEWKWSLATLQQAFTRLTSLTTPRFKLCFFIDGLDECEGDQEDLAEYFLKISALPNVKICVSSRPWLIYEDTFNGCLGLRLQDLTCNDMRVYVHDKLVADQRMQRLSISDPEAASKFIKTTETKANGVFLWVKLVTKSLLKGLRNQDNIADLQKRLESLPSDLDALYCLMLNRIDYLYIEQASQIFQIYDRASDLDLRMSVLELELAVTAKVGEGIKIGREAMGTEEINTRCDKMTTHLKTRCEGLLEVHDLLDRQWDSFDDDIDMDSSAPRIENDEDTLDQHAERLRTKVDLKVSYLHRTVKDFLKTDFVRAKFRDETASMAEFDPNLALLVSYVINMKRSICSLYYDIAGLSWDSRIWNVMRDALLFAKSMNNKADSSRNLLLHELYVLGQQWWQHKSLSLDIKLLNPNPYRQASEWYREFMSLAVYFGLTSFVDEKLKQEKALCPGPHVAQLLTYALNLSQPTITSILLPAVHSTLPEMVEVILKHGADPNEAIPRNNQTTSNSYTIWENLLRSTRSRRSTQKDLDVLRQGARIFEAMIRYGADIFATCPLHTRAGPSELKNSRAGSCRVADVLVDTFAEHLPDETTMLYEFLKRKISATSNGGRHNSSEECGKTRKRQRGVFHQTQDTGGRTVINLLDDDEKATKPEVLEIYHLHAIKKVKIEVQPP